MPETLRQFGPKIRRPTKADQWLAEYTCFALHGEAMVGRNREGHRDLARRRIVGGDHESRNRPSGEMVVFLATLATLQVEGKENRDMPLWET
jgi:hypothetical protein